MPKGYVAPCHGCGLVVGQKTYVRVGANREAPFCPNCLPAAREAARSRPGGLRMAKASTQPAGLCTGGTPHHYDLTTGVDAEGRCGDRGVCRGCGAVKFWAWPTPKDLSWSSLRKEVA